MKRVSPISEKVTEQMLWGLGLRNKKCSVELKLLTLIMTISSVFSKIVEKTGRHKVS